MNAPIATYRVQLNKTFGFADLKAIVPYLSELGVLHIYASPIFQAKKGSTHGYDITDPNTINPELGGEADLLDLMREVKAYGLGWLQDIVPNHASYSLENRKVYDLLQKGTASRYSSFFDADWKHPSPRLKEKIIVPFLAEPYAHCLKEGKIQLAYNEGYKIKYGNLEFPINTQTQQKLSLQSAQQNLEFYNHNPNLLHQLLKSQYYVLSYWKTALKHINYRRFFDIIDLIGLRQEDQEVFEQTHHLIFQLLDSAFFSGLRVDHIDGLYDPEEYLLNLRRRFPEVYVVVEKILTSDEQLPSYWPVEGTTGYDFVNIVNQVFVDTSSEQSFDAFYQMFTGNTEPFADLLYDAKKVVLMNYFLGDVRNLAGLLNKTLQDLAYGKPYLRGNLVLAAVELLTCFPLYRTYLSPTRHSDAPLRFALKEAQQRAPQLAKEFTALTYLLDKAGNSAAALRALMRLQQFTGAVMAKGFEDTALYRYTKLISLNEVGGNPAEFGISTKQFHTFNERRQRNWPLTMIATSSHDTKRGEDVRARLNVLSEIPIEFQKSLEEWANANLPLKKEINGQTAPDRNEEYYLYQTLLGAYPWYQEEMQAFSERIKQHMTKALREAKTNSTWLSPNIPYENTVSTFTAEVFDNTDFVKAFLPLQQKIAFYGLFNTLAQTLLKITCPGIPDFYQGTELWDLNFVDPDNRRPVDFELRKKLLAEIMQMKAEKAHELIKAYGDGKAKLYVIYRALELRRKMRLLFEQGTYIPLAVKGFCSEHAVAFCRALNDAYVLTVVPRFLANLLYIGGGGYSERDSTVGPYRWNGAVDWADTYLCLPEGAPVRWIDVFTDKTIMGCCGRLPMRDVLDTFPVALLVGDSNA